MYDWIMNSQAGKIITKGLFIIGAALSFFFFGYRKGSQNQQDKQNNQIKKNYEERAKINDDIEKITDDDARDRLNGWRLPDN